MDLERRPVTDIRRNFKEILKCMHKNKKPVYLTTNEVDTLLLVPINLAEKFELFLETIQNNKE